MQKDLFGKSIIEKKLAVRYCEMPFTILDASTHRWRGRKQFWLRSLNLKGISKTTVKSSAYGSLPELAKKANPKSKNQDTFSVFDPVLAELMYKWFCPVGGRILDPFAGEAVKGVVAGKLGFHYTGIELRADQVKENKHTARQNNIQAKWVCGDSENLSELLEGERKYDFIFTSPPYYDLEIYSESDKDGSAFETYEKFMKWYRSIFKQAVRKLNKNRFLCVKIGEIRDKKTGFYRNFVGDNIRCLLDCGMQYYNEAVLLSPSGTARLRTRPFEMNRKLVKLHQNVLIFYKGDVSKIRDDFKVEGVPDEIEVPK
jgi:16S rRNA G966 N2-methylase RsmD